MSFLQLSKFSETKTNKTPPHSWKIPLRTRACICVYVFQRQRQRERGSVCEDLTMQPRTASIQFFCTAVPGLRLTACRKFLAVITLCPCLLLKKGFWPLVGIVKITKVISQYYAASFLVNVSVGPTISAVGVPKYYVKQLVSWWRKLKQDVSNTLSVDIQKHTNQIYQYNTSCFSVEKKLSRKTPSLYMTNEISKLKIYFLSLSKKKFQFIA